MSESERSQNEIYNYTGEINNMDEIKQSALVENNNNIKRSSRIVNRNETCCNSKQNKNLSI